MDGARLFNAATALGVPVAQVTQHVDSVTFCLSKVIYFITCITIIVEPLHTQSLRSRGAQCG